MTTVVGKLLVGTENGVIDGQTGEVMGFAGRDVTAMADGWVVLDGHQLCRRSGEPGPAVATHRVRCMEMDPGENAWIGTAEAHVFRLAEDEVQLVESFEGAPGRGDWHTPWGGAPDARSISSASGLVLVNIHVGGILRSADGGASWQPTIDLEHDVHQVLSLEDGTAVAACAHGLATSHDQGLTWSVEDDGMHATYSRAVAVSGGTVLLSTSTGPGGDHSAIYRRPLKATGQLERCRKGLPEWLGGNVDTFWLTGSPDGRTAFATRSGDAYLSEDEGETWQLVATGLPAVRAVSLG